jgi:signal transduction histidine kinase
VRVTVVTAAILFAVVSVVLVAVAVTYQSRLRSDLRHRLLVAGTTVSRTGSERMARQLSSGLALEGIATRIDPYPPAAHTDKRAAALRSPPIKPGAAITQSGTLLSLTEQLPDGARVTFTASDGANRRSFTDLVALESVIGLAGLAVAVLLVVVITNATMRPLSRVIDTATAIAAGDTSKRLLPDRTHTELGALATAFDSMVEALQAAIAEARTAEATMNRFVADAAHELRTPIAALQATAERLLREQPDRPERDQLEAIIAARAAGLGRLVNDLLSLARLQGAPIHHDDRVDLLTLLKTVIAEATSRDNGPTVRLDADPVFVRGDADSLTRAVHNIVDNACSAAPHGTITVQLKQSDAHAIIVVHDTGPGIPQADRERIFEPFARLPTTATPGTGLGLAIARRIARQHHGDLTCDSSKVGASFTLLLPRNDEPLTRMPIPTSTHYIDA